MRWNRLLPLLLCAAASIFSGVSAYSARDALRDARMREDRMASVVTNLLGQASRVDALEEALRSLPVLSSDAPERFSSGPVGNIPYRYFSASGYRGISNGTSNVVVGQRCRYGVLTACGRDFAEFDEYRVYGLEGPVNDGITSSRDNKML